MTIAQETKIEDSGYRVVINNRSITSTGGKNEIRNDAEVGLGIKANIVKKKEVGTAAKNIASNYAVVQQDNVPATILRKEDVSVLCEVELQAGRVHIKLPRCLFPEDIHFGMPITIRFDEEPSGIRKPSVSLRKINTEGLREENEEMRLLFEDF